MLQFTALSMSELGCVFLHLESASASLLRRTLLSSSCSRSRFLQPPIAAGKSLSSDNR